MTSLKGIIGTDIRISRRHNSVEWSPDDLKRFQGLQPFHVSLVCVYRSLVLSIVVGRSVKVLCCNNISLKKILEALVGYFR